MLGDVSVKAVTSWSATESTFMKTSRCQGQIVSNYRLAFASWGKKISPDPNIRTCSSLLGPCGSTCPNCLQRKCHVSWLQVTNGASIWPGIGQRRYSLLNHSSLPTNVRTGPNKMRYRPPFKAGECFIWNHSRKEMFDDLPPFLTCWSSSSVALFGIIGWLKTMYFTLGGPVHRQKFLFFFF